jgi:microcystin-dependent protein
MLGSRYGTETVKLSGSTLPAHAHSTPDGEDTTTTGGGQPFDNAEPSLTLTYIIAVQGIFPSRNRRGLEEGGQRRLDTSFPWLGEIALFAGNFAPTGWLECRGQILPISTNTALFALLGTQYGGNGIQTFALPGGSSSNTSCLSCVLGT